MWQVLAYAMWFGDGRSVLADSEALAGAAMWLWCILSAARLHAAPPWAGPLQREVQRARVRGTEQLTWAETEC